MASIDCHFCLKALGTQRQQKNTMDPSQHHGGLASIKLPEQASAQQVLLPSQSLFICQCEQDLEKSVKQSVKEGQFSLSDNKEGLSLTKELTQSTN